MSVHGFATHAAYNRRQVGSLVGAYLLAFVGVGLFALSPIDILLFNVRHSLFVDPVGYTLRVAPWILPLAGGIIVWNLHVLKRELTEVLMIAPADVTREQRFLRIAEEQCILQGMRKPQFGVIETSARNAVTVGALVGPPLIAVTRGLLDDLDDDEIAAVIAHEIAHFRVGDTRLIAFNYALMRTANAFQAYNPIKIDRNVHTPVQWHMVIAVFLPIFIVYMLLGGLFTMLCWRLARFADGRVRTGRDFIADGEAIRFTKFPEALEAAIGKCAGHGYFDEAERVEAVLFEGSSPASGGTHADPRERLAAIRQHAAELLMPGRVRRDTRIRASASAAPSLHGFGRKVVIAASSRDGFAAADRKREKPEPPSFARALTFWTDPPAHRRWRRSVLDHFRWRVSDRRNIFGFMPDMTPWVVGALALSSVFHWSVADGDPAEFAAAMSGQSLVAGSDEAFAELVCSFSEGAKDLHDCKAERLAAVAADGGPG